jgi:hypothetical protein
VAVVLLLPWATSSLYHHTQSVPAFFTSGQYRSELKPSDRVFALPYGAYGSSMAWQEAADFDFELVGGYAEPPPQSYELPVIQQLGRQGTFSAQSAGELRRFLAEKGATVVIVDAADPGPGREVLRALGLQGRQLGGVVLARLSP